jgi:Ca2+-binding EF-hand superfamily protein
MDGNPADGIVSKQEYLAFRPTSAPTATPATPSSTQDPKATIFSSMDTDNSGEISLAEVRSFMENTDGAVPEQQVQDRFAQMDVNQDGIVSKEEYLSRAVNATNVSPFANVSFNEGFHTFDTDGTGKPHRKEFEKAMSSLGMRLSQHTHQVALWVSDSKPVIRQHTSAYIIIRRIHIR